MQASTTLPTPEVPATMGGTAPIEKTLDPHPQKLLQSCPGTELNGRIYGGGNFKRWKEIAKPGNGKFTLLSAVDRGVEYSTKYRKKDPPTHDGDMMENEKNPKYLLEGRKVEWDGRKIYNIWLNKCPGWLVLADTAN